MRNAITVLLLLVASSARADHYSDAVEAMDAAIGHYAKTSNTSIDAILARGAATTKRFGLLGKMSPELADWSQSLLDDAASCSSYVLDPCLSNAGFWYDAIIEAKAAADAANNPFDLEVACSAIDYYAANLGFCAAEADTYIDQAFSDIKGVNTILSLYK